MDVTKRAFYGWHSEAQKNNTGWAVYATPSGGEVEVTEVTSVPYLDENNFPDMKYVGMVMQMLYCSDEDELVGLR